MVTLYIGAPVDEDERGQDHVGRKKIVGVCEKSRTGHGPDLPVEAIGVDVVADLDSSVCIGLYGKYCQLIFSITGEIRRVFIVSPGDMVLAR